MKLKYRRWLSKIDPIYKIIRMIIYNSGYFFYHQMYVKKNYKKLFNELYQREKGRRCFIIGNGPSLNITDLDKLIGEDCIGTNEIHKVFNETKWRPKYYLIMDRYSKSTPEQIRDLDCKTVFLGDYYWRFNNVLRKDAICLHQHLAYDEHNYLFSEDIGKQIVNSPTVSYGAMQIAVYLGYKEIYLLGFDHNYMYEVNSDGNIVKTNKEKTHFFKDEKPEEIIANVRGMTRAYIAFKEYSVKHGITVKNVTRGGKLELFERMELDKLLNKY